MTKEPWKKLQQQLIHIIELIGSGKFVKMLMLIIILNL